MGTKRPIIANILLVLLSIVSTLLLGEIVLRVFKPIHKGHHKLFCRYDPLLGWAKIPNATGKHWTDEFSVTERMNSRGIRGPEYSYAKDPEKTRILILGDSFAEGYTVEFDNLFSEVLKASLNSIGNQSYEVINTGTGGWSTDQELLFFIHEGVKYRPDITLLMFYHNDVCYNAGPKYMGDNKPLFVLKDGRLELTNVPVPKTKSAGLTEFIKSPLREHILLYTLASKVKSLLTASDNVPNLLPADWGVFAKRPEPSIVECWNITEHLLIKLSQETSGIRSKLLVVYIPFRAAIYRDEWQAIAASYRLNPTDWDPDFPGRTLKDLCNKNDIAFYDLSNELMKAKKLTNNQHRLYHVHDVHWTIYGNSVVGRSLASYLYGTLLK